MGNPSLSIIPRLILVVEMGRRSVARIMSMATISIGRKPLSRLIEFIVAVIGSLLLLTTKASRSGSLTVIPNRSLNSTISLLFDGFSLLRNLMTSFFLCSKLSTLWGLWRVFTISSLVIPMITYSPNDNAVLNNWRWPLWRRSNVPPTATLEYLSDFSPNAHHLW